MRRHSNRSLRWPLRKRVLMPLVTSINSVSTMSAKPPASAAVCAEFGFEEMNIQKRQCSRGEEAGEQNEREGRDECGYVSIHYAVVPVIFLEDALSCPAGDRGSRSFRTYFYPWNSWGGRKINQIILQ